jgi:HD-GYP domain-containing protein (c-di-GMP phosphodiesterase class II)
MEELATRIALTFMKTEAIKREKVQQFRMVEKVMENDKRVEETFLRSIRSFINAIEARDRYTKGHSIRVSGLVDQLLKMLGINSYLASDIVLASQLHDIGKMGVSDTILNKHAGLSLRAVSRRVPHHENPSRGGLLHSQTHPFRGGA